MDREYSHFSPAHYEKVTSTSGPFSWLNPTTRRYPVSKRARPTTAQQQTSQETLGQDGQKVSGGSDGTGQSGDGGMLASSVDQKWRSRDNRKGRHAVAVTPASHNDATIATPPPTNSVKETLKGIGRMFSTYPYWDVSYLVAIIFTLGSVVWCINGFFEWLPLQDPDTEFNDEITSGGGITAFIGATIFEVGSVLLMIEAVNENRADCFGWALEEAIEEGGFVRLRQDHDGCKHHHQNKKNFIGKGKAVEGKPSLDAPLTDKDQPVSKSARTWTWWPSWHELTHHYFREIGFLACAAQMFGATIFWISGFTALPGVNDVLSPAGLNGAFWAPQVIGGSGFIVSGILFMLETQQKWYLPAPKVLGWHIGMWNLIGALGFTLCGALGYSSSDAVLYQGSLATFWGSWAFLIGSVIQWFESLDKHPVDVEEGGGRIADTQPVVDENGEKIQRSDKTQE